MNVNAVRAWVSLVVLVTLIGVVQASPLRAATVVGSVTGSGHSTLSGEKRTFVFAAQLFDDGTAQGQAQLQARQVDVTVHLELDCLRFFGSSRAIMRGVGTRTSDNQLVPRGSLWVFGVEDNGAGANATPDQITPVVLTTRACQDIGELFFSIAELQPIEQGNIQVRPPSP